VSATDLNLLMLCGETVALCCENRTEHTDTLWAVRTSQETHCVSATEPNRLVLFVVTTARSLVYPIDSGLRLRSPRLKYRHRFRLF
jgi:hypothetical protein